MCDVDRICTERCATDRGCDLSGRKIVIAVPWWGIPDDGRKVPKTLILTGVRKRCDTRSVTQLRPENVSERNADNSGERLAR